MDAGRAQWAVFHTRPNAQGLGAAIEVPGSFCGRQVCAVFPVEGNQVLGWGVGLHFELLHVVEQGCNVVATAFAE